MNLAELLSADLLPEEIQEELQARRQAMEARVASISRVVKAKRELAVRGRRASGIEWEWQRCEDQYAGIDDANREDARELKAANPDGALTDGRAGNPLRSTAYLNITRPYTDAAAARMIEVLLPTDSRNWALKPTPVPQLLAARGDYRPLPQLPPTAGPLPATDKAPAPPMPTTPDGQPAPRPTTVADLAAARMTKATEQAEAAQRRIDDWLTQSHYNSELRRVINELARLGTGCLKGPYPKRNTSKKISIKDGVHTIEKLVEIAPASRAISVWNCYPDPNCGHNIHNGGYFFERDDIEGRELRKLGMLPGYNKARIADILEAGPAHKYADAEGGARPRDDTTDPDSENFEIWYFYGEIDQNDFRALGMDPEDAEALFDDCLLSDSGQTIAALVTLVNDIPIKVARNPLDSGEFPYDFVVWQERPNSPWGYGVPWQIRVPQNVATAALRNLMDNAGLAGGPIIVVDQAMLAPADGDWTIAPRKVFTTLEGAMGKDVRTAFMAVNIPMLQAEMMNIINFALKTAEDVTGLPMLLQGQLGKAPDTVGGMQMLQANASGVVRRLAKTFDDMMTTRHIGAYYEWLLLYGPEDSEKGDFFIDALGSSALVERDMQNQLIVQMVAMSLNPAYDLSPPRCMEEFLRSVRLDPARFKPTEAERQAMAQQQPPVAPQVQAAQIRAEADLQKEQMRQQTEQAGIAADTDRDTQYVLAETERTQNEYNIRMQELGLKRELAMLDYANKHNMTLEQIKADLATNAAKINLQRELATTPPAGAPQVARPPTEPPGRAPNGMAFQR